ncbi:hypothetical protein Tco_0600128 [Tanacetum coccineum]|uniref:DUF4216 domain-containing protein n=1 Tax=Tanacetum coccineum TaxID=301880 RepID=A0ABQ4WB00_9ASTR
MAAEPQLLEAAGMVMMAVGDGVRCGGVDGGCGVAAAEKGGSGDDVWRGCDGCGGSVVMAAVAGQPCRDERRITQNSGICSPGEKDREMYYGQLEEILEFSYMSFKVVLFRVKWFDTSNEGRKIKRFVIRNNITQIWAHGESFKDDQYILATQVIQVFYLGDMARRLPNWKVVQDLNHKKFPNEGVLVIEDDHDVIHFDNSSDLALSTSLVDLDFTTLNIDGQSIDVDAPLDIIDVNKDDYLIDDEDALPYDLADSGDEDLANDDDDVAVVYSSEEED